MNRALSFFGTALLLCSSSVFAQDIELPASALTVEHVVPLSQVNVNGGPRTVLAVDPLAVYSSVTSFSGQAYANGGSTANITRMVVDDITFNTNPGVGNVVMLRFSVANLNGTPQSVRARVRIYDATGAAMGGGLPNGPGAYVAGYSFSVLTYAPGITVLSGTLGAGFAVPAGATTTLWAGITFDNVGTTTGATNAELNNFGTGLFSAVDVGSSVDTLFQTTAAGSFVSNNPAGAAFNFGGASPATNGWELVVSALGTPSADLTLALTDTPDPVTAGNAITYLATSTNNGPNPAPDLSISLPLPATTTFVSANPGAGGSCSGVAVGANGTLTCTWAGNTAQGASRSVSVDVGVPVNTADGVSLTLNASTASLGNDPVPVNNVASVTTAVVTRADLSITLTDSPDPVVAGTNLTYTATATNNGPSDAQGVNITLPLPAGTSFVSATPSVGGVCNAATPVLCTWAGATAPAGVHSVDVVAAVAAATVGNLIITATVASATTDLVAANNTASASTVIDISADVSVTLTDAPDPVIAGTNLNYTATATNNGPSDAQGVNISLPLPAGTSFVSATPSAGGSCNAVSPVLCTWAGATVPAAVRSVIVVASVASVTTGTLSATATVAATSPDANPGNDTSTASTTVNTQADLSITLTDTPDPVTAGTNLSYTATVSNAGPSDAVGVTVTLPLPANASLVSGSVAGGGSCAGSPVVCSFSGSLVAAGSRAASVTLLVSPSAPNGSNIAATATAAAATPDIVLGNNTASTSTAVITSANLQLTLSASSLAVLVNEPVTFTASSLNLGPSDAQNLSITVTLTPDFRYTGHTATGATCTVPQVGTTGAITCIWTGATALNATRTLQVVAYSNNVGATAVNASTTSDTTDPATVNNIGNVSVQVGFSVEGIPSMSPYGLILLGLMLGLLGVVAVRREN